MALYSRLGADTMHDKPLPSLPSPTLTNPDMVLPDIGSPKLSSPAGTVRRAPSVSYLRDKTNEHQDIQTTPPRDQQRRGPSSRRILPVRTQAGSASSHAFSSHDEGSTPVASSPLLHDRIEVSQNGQRRGSNSSLDSEEMAKMPEFLQKYRNVDMTDDDATDIDGRAYDRERRAKEEEEQASALLSKRAEEILANAKKRLNLMEGNLRGARDLVAPLTAANLKRATSLSHSLGSSPTSYAHRRLESVTYDQDPYNPSRRMLHSQTSSPTMGRDYYGHARGSSDLDMDRPHTSMSRSRFPIRTPGTSGRSPDWTSGLRSSRSFDSFGISKLVIPDDGKALRMKNSPDSNLEPVSEDDGQHHIETSYRNSLRAPEVVGLGVDMAPSTSGSSASDDLRDQMATLKGRISSLRERAREDSMRRASASNLRNPSPFNNAAHNAPELWYNQSSSQVSPGVATGSPATPQFGQHPWPHHAPTGSRNAFAELAAREAASKSSGSSSPNPQNTTSSHKRTRSGTAIVDPANVVSHHTYKGSADMPGAYIDKDLEESASEKYDSDEYEASPASGGSSGEYDDDRSGSSSEEDDEDYMEEASIYEDAIPDDSEVIAHEDRDDAFDYEHFFLHSAMGSYNAGRISPTESDASSVASTETERAPQAQPEAEPDEYYEGEVPRTPGTPDALRQIEARLQHQHGRSMSNESLSTLNTFATADESHSRSQSRMDWPITPTAELPRPPTAQAGAVTLASAAEMDDGSDRADSGVGGLSNAAGQQASKVSANATSSVSAPSSPATAVTQDPTTAAFKALLDPAGKDLGLKDKAVVFSLIESLRRVCVRLQEEDEDQYESRVLRRRLDDARRVLDGLGIEHEP